MPQFTYHPNPLATGSVVASETVGQACGRARGYIYGGPVYGGPAGMDLDNVICPSCIANGTAHQGFSVEFTDAAGIGQVYTVP